MSIFDSIFRKLTGKSTAAPDKAVTPAPTPAPAPAVFVSPPAPVTPPAPAAPMVPAPKDTSLGQMPGKMTTSSVGIALIKGFEGCRLTAYQCSASVWTIGYGSTGAHVHPGKRILQSDADALLIKDLTRFEDGVNNVVKVPISQAMFDALISLAFNIGLGALGKSTLLRKLNACNYTGAATEFLKWDKAAGKPLLGLTRRRHVEKQVFEKGIDEDAEVKALINAIMIS